MDTIEKTQNIVEDEKLVEQVVTGRNSEDTTLRKRSEEAFATLFGKYKSPLLFKFKISNGQNDADAEDLLMQTLEKAFKSIDKYNPEYAFSTWIYAIARNLYIDGLRKNTGVDVVNIEGCFTDDGEGNAMEFELEDSQKTPDEKMIADERADMVRKAVCRIKNKSVQEMVILFFFKQKTYKEIADITGVPIGTVKGNLNRGKKKLTDTLASLNINAKIQ